MHQLNHHLQFNPRSTMPSMGNRINMKSSNQPQQRLQKSHMETYLNSTQAQQTTFNSFFVRISRQSLQEQKRIYQWRMDCNEGFIGISNFKLQSEGNLYNPNYLFKIQLPISRSNFMQIKDLCLTKCVILLKATLRAIELLFQYFQPVVFTEKMIHMTEEGNIKVWMDDRFYINPNNELYIKNTKEVQFQESLRSVIDIFFYKCLKTKLSTKLFTTLQNTNSFRTAIIAIQNFEFQQNLFPIQGLKNSVSTCAAFNTSSSIQFSVTKSAKKRKSMKGNNKKLQFKLKNIASHKFLQAKSMEININVISSQIDKYRVTHKSQHKEPEANKQQNYAIKINSDKPSSLIISQLFKSDSEINPENKKQNRTQQLEKVHAIQENVKTNNNFLSPDYHTENRSLNLIPEYEDHNVQTILSKNGWNNNVVSLFDRRNVKQSLCEGKQINSHLQGFKLKHLHTMGKQVRQSILPVDQQLELY